MPNMRSNKVSDEEAAEMVDLPGVVKNNERQVNFLELTDNDFNSNTDKKSGEDAREGSLAAAEGLQGTTDQRRGKEVTKPFTKTHI